jgi:hypothetical protein
MMRIGPEGQDCASAGAANTGAASTAAPSGASARRVIMMWGSLPAWQP